MAMTRSRARLQYALVNVLFCYGAFAVTGVVTWVHLHGDTARPEEVPLPHRLKLTQMAAGFKPDPGVADRDLPAEKPPEPAGNRSDRAAAAVVVGTAKPDARSASEKEEIPKQQQTVERREPLEKPPTPTAEAKCTKTIASLTKYSGWFRERFKPQTKLFLDKTDLNLKDFRAMSRRILPNGLRGQQHKLFSDILLHKNFTNPPVHGPHRKPGCVSCAVVGSGGILNRSRAGKEIDSHDYVFRVNQAYVSGEFAPDVGHRTTFYTFYPESQNISKQAEGVISFYTMFKSYDVQYALRILNGENYTNAVSKIKINGTTSRDVEPRRLKLVHPGFFLYITEQFLAKKFRPTTGALSVFLALHICDDVKVYGFGYSAKYSLHYYDREFVKHKNTLTVPHNIDMERQLWLKLHDEGAIKLFKRDL